MRITKDPEERRNEILDAADELLGQKALTAQAPAIFSKRLELRGERCIITSSRRRILWTR